ncbi:unnamed protein product [Anisakis simplex]|uniref:IQ motif containing E n=1 Tax=Anisakis simplex TaxID=6269 RepID=A0A0M3J0H3_ANISI|nr:unnamed protein product [Anisakis simplex]
MERRAPKMKADSVDSTKQLAEVQGEPEGTAGTSIDLITQLLCERLKMIQSHRKECQAAIQLAKQILSAQQWVTEGNQRENQASALKIFLESNPQAEEVSFLPTNSIHSRTYDSFSHSKSITPI